jgi:hypothetical protein
MIIVTGLTFTFSRFCSVYDHINRSYHHSQHDVNETKMHRRYLEGEAMN